MSDGDAGGIGARVATLRKLQGLKQHQFATKAHLSISLVKKVESGHAPASPAFAAASARALGVEVSALTGQPYDDTTADAAADHAAIPELRRALDSHDAPEIDGPILSAAELRAQFDDGESLRRRSRYSDLAARLPELLYHAYAITAEAAQGGSSRLAGVVLSGDHCSWSWFGCRGWSAGAGGGVAEASALVGGVTEAVGFAAFQLDDPVEALGLGVGHS